MQFGEVARGVPPVNHAQDARATFKLHQYAEQLSAIATVVPYPGRCPSRSGDELRLRRSRHVVNINSNSNHQGRVI